MFKNREKFNKFLSIATPILLGVNIFIVLIKFLGVFVLKDEYIYKMFAFATMHNPPGFMYHLHYNLASLIMTANIAYGVLCSVALSMIKDDEKHRTLSLVFAITSFVLMTTLMSLGFAIRDEWIGYWVVPIWFIVLAYHIAFPLILFFKFLRIKKSQNQ